MSERSLRDERPFALVTAAVFDLGGVLIDWSPYYLYRKLLDSDEEIARFLDEIDLFNWLQGVDADKPFQRGVAELSARLPQHAELIEAYWHRWEETLNGSLDDSLATGDYSPLRGWLIDNVYRHGRAFTPAELLQRSTGGGLDTGPYLAYLQGKFSELYAL